MPRPCRLRLLAPRRWVGLAVGLMAAPAGLAADRAGFRWSELPVLPDPVGFAGMFAGVSGDAILAAGGHRFAEGVPWWDGGAKVWSDAVFIYSRTANRWSRAPEVLTRPLGDGVSVTFNDALICAGGGDADRAYADVFSLRRRDGRLQFTPLPSLPAPCLRSGGALVGSVLYLVGGRAHPTTGPASRTFWALDLAAAPSAQRWQSLPPWPGPARMMPVVASAGGALLMFGGIEVVVDQGGKSVNRAPYLRDAYRYRPGAGGAEGRWETLPALPHPVAGAPSPAWTPNASTVVIFGGVDGSIEAIADRSSVRALPDRLLALDLDRNAWRDLGPMPPATVRVNAPTVIWDDACLIISGEHLPARRTNAVTRISPAADAVRR